MAKDILKYKAMHVDFLQIFESFNDTKGKLCTSYFNLTPYLEQCLKINVKDRVINYKGEVARLQHIEKIPSPINENLKESKNIWKLHFIRIRTNHRTGIASESGDYSDTLLDEKLDDDQHLAEPTACLYDCDHNLFIISRNRDSVLPSGILDFFAKISNNMNLHLAIIPTKANFDSKSPKLYRRFCVGISNINNIKSDDNEYLKKHVPCVFNAINNFKAFGCSNVYFEISMGDSPRNISMSNSEINSAVLGLMQYEIENIDKVEVKLKENIDTNIETIDLFSNKLQDSFNISYSKGIKITHERLINELLNSYNKNVLKIKK